jgi:uncharacterized membrane protein
MQNNESTLLAQAIGLGAIAGMRSMAAPALVSHHLAHDHDESLGRPFSLVGSPTVATLLKFPALGEMVLDKLPIVPSRIELPPLLGRIGSGALVGATLYKTHGRNLLVGALVGGLAALASTYLIYHIRRVAGERLPVPDGVLGAVEDAVVLGGGFAFLKQAAR